MDFTIGMAIPNHTALLPRRLRSPVSCRRVQNAVRAYRMTPLAFFAASASCARAPLRMWDNA